MKLLFTFIPILFSTLLYAQENLENARVEENLFIMKLIGVGVLFLLAMPLVLKKLRSMQPKEEHHRVVFENDEADEADEAEEKVPFMPKTKVQEVVKEEEVDPLEMALETLLLEHQVSDALKAELTPLYREYLELRMDRVKIATGSFDFNTLLDALVKRVQTYDESRNLELVFDVAANVPSKIIGDITRLEKLLFYVIENVLLKNDSYLLDLKIRRLDKGNQALHLAFWIPYCEEGYEADKADIFKPFSAGETSSGLELYLAKKYAELMHGDITFEPDIGRDASAFKVVVTLYMPNPDELRHYRLPSKKMIGHSVLIVDDQPESAEAVKKMFEYFKNGVDAFSSKELFEDLNVMKDYDIVVIQERFFAKNLLSKLKELKANHNIKVVSLNKHEGFVHLEEEVKLLLDGELAKPVTIQKVFDLLILIYKEKH